MTQAELAHALKIALPTVGRWESWNPPTGSSLDMLARFAEARGLDASVFLRALEESMVPVSFAVTSWEEAHQVHAFLETLRSPEFAVYRPRVLRALAPVIKATDCYIARKKDMMRLGDSWLRQKLSSKPPKEDKGKK